MFYGFSESILPLSNFAVVGLSHNTALVSQREEYAVSPAALPSALSRLKANGISEAVILSTCNRTEIYAATSDVSLLSEFFAKKLTGKKPAACEINKLIFQKEGEEALSYLFEVSSGLRSQVVGETEILGQIKQSWAASRSLGFCETFINKIFQSAIATGKRVRFETRIGAGKVSIASLALDYARSRVSDLAGASIAVIGTGDVARRLLKEIEKIGPRKSFVISHTVSSRTQTLAEEYKASPLPVGAVSQLLEDVDVVFSATSAPHPVLDRATLDKTSRDFSKRPAVVIDLGMPRNVAIDVADINGITLCDLDHLKELSERFSLLRQDALPQAKRIISEELLVCREWFSRRRAVPIIHALRARAERMRLEQIKWALPKLGLTDTAQVDLLNQMSKRLVNQILNSQLGAIKEISKKDENALAVYTRHFIDSDREGTSAKEQADKALESLPAKRLTGS